MGTSVFKIGCDAWTRPVPALASTFSVTALANDFEHEGRKLTVRLTPNLGSYRAQVYDGEEPVGPPYDLDHGTIITAALQRRYEGTIQHAVETARDRIVMGNVPLPPKKTSNL
jgi:hypothetical protein